jgi:SAM-dependent methyltransferase
VPLFAPAHSESSEHFPRGDVEKLSAVEDGHFWFAARNDLIVWTISSYFPDAQTLLEVGCGTGIVLTRVREDLPHLRLTGGDLLPVALDIARDRVPEATFVQIDIRSLPFAGEFDVICALDVLEHVDEDTLAVEQLSRALRPGGGIIVSVPQHMWLWSAADEYGRHRRRYSRRQLVGLLDQAGFDVVRATSSVSLLLPVVALSRVRRRQLTDDYDPFRELALSERVNRALGAVMSAERRLIRRGLSFPLGSSLVVVAKRR